MWLIQTDDQNLKLADRRIERILNVVLVYWLSQQCLVAMKLRPLKKIKICIFNKDIFLICKLVC